MTARTREGRTPTLWHSDDERQHYKLTEDAEWKDDLRYALWSCNVVIARFRTRECALQAAQALAAWLKEAEGESA